MEDDFNMITRRYVKLFNSLNKALENRVKELDRPAMQLADLRKSMVFDKLKDDSSMLFSISYEALPFAQTALSGKLKQKTRETMLTLAESIDENRVYSEKVDSILVKKNYDDSGDSGLYYVPAILFSTDSLLNPDDYIDNVYLARTEEWQNTGPIVSEISNVQSDLKWVPANAEETDRVRKEVLSLCEKESLEERVSKEIIRLFDESVWEDCANELQ
jgi:hypothetical protein